MPILVCCGPDSRPAAASYVGQLDLIRCIQSCVLGTLVTPRDTMLTCFLRAPLLVADMGSQMTTLGSCCRRGQCSTLWKHLGGTPNPYLEVEGSFPKVVMFSIDREKN